MAGLAAIGVAAVVAAVAATAAAVVVADAGRTCFASGLPLELVLIWQTDYAI